MYKRQRKSQACKRRESERQDPSRGLSPGGGRAETQGCGASQAVPREKPLCKLCGERGTLVHILLTCMAVLSQASMARSPEHRLSSWSGNDKHMTNLIDPENKEEPPVAAGDEVSSEGNHTFPQPIMF